MKLYIARHGETEWNKEMRMQGHKNSNLTEKGIYNAKLLGVSLKDVDIKKVYVSPLGRTKETIFHIFGEERSNIQYLKGLEEMNFGDLEGLTIEERTKELMVVADKFWSEPHLYKSSNGEEFIDFINRVKETLSYIVKDARDEDVFIVTHTCVIKAIFLLLNNADLKDFWSNGPYIKDTSLTILEFNGEKFTCIKEADISHIK